MTAVASPFQLWTNLLGLPLEFGYIYVGEDGADPEVSPAPVFWDEDMTFAAVQPLRTLAGVIVNAGAPATVYVEGRYSLRVRQFNGVQVFYAPSVADDVADVDTLAASLAGPGGAALVSYKAPDTNSYARPLSSVADDSTSFLNWIPASLHADIRTGLLSGNLDTYLAAMATDLTDGRLVWFPKGNYKFTNGAVFSAIRLQFIGEGAQATVFQFDPVAAATLLKFDAPGSGPTNSQWQGRIEGIQFNSANSVDKIAIEIIDGRGWDIVGNTMFVGGWNGANSTFADISGRDTMLMTRNKVNCSNPVVCRPNAAFPTLALDHFQIDDNEFKSTLATGTVIDIKSGALVTNTTISRNAIQGGQNGIRIVDTASTINGYALTIEKNRFEQSNGGGWDINIDPALPLENLTLTTNVFSTENSGARIRNTRKTIIDNAQFTTAAGVTLDIVAIAQSTLELRAIASQGAATKNFVNLLSLHSVPSGISGAPLPVSGTYVYNAGAAINQTLVSDYSGKSWTLSNYSMAVDEVINVPFLTARGALAVRVSIAGYSATGPFAAFGDFGWSPAGVELVVGNANVAAAVTAGKLCVIDSPGNPVLVNKYTSPVTIHIKAHGAA